VNEQCVECDVLCVHKCIVTSDWRALDMGVATHTHTHIHRGRERDVTVSSRLCVRGHDVLARDPVSDGDLR